MVKCFVNDLIVFSYVNYIVFPIQAGEKPLPPEDDNAIREYLSVKAYLVSIYLVFRWICKDKI